MVTFNDIGNSSNIPTMTLYGLSTDTKPTVTENGNSIPNGSKFLSINNSKVYIFDAENSVWYEWT